MNEWEEHFGKVAYNAYCDTLGSSSGLHLPFDEHPAELKEVWTAAAHAAIAAFRADVEQNDDKAKAA